MLRDEGEAYARKLISVGPPVTAMRYLGPIRDFVMLNGLRSKFGLGALAGRACSTRQCADAGHVYGLALQKLEGSTQKHRRRDTDADSVYSTRSDRKRTVR